MAPVSRRVVAARYQNTRIHIERCCGARGVTTSGRLAMGEKEDAMVELVPRKMHQRGKAKRQCVRSFTWHSYWTCLGTC